LFGDEVIVFGGHYWTDDDVLVNGGARTWSR